MGSVSLASRDGGGRGVLAGAPGSDAGYDPRTGKPKKPQNPVEDMYNLYDSSVERQSGDYDDIMRRYRSIYDNPDGGGGGGGSGSSSGGASTATFRPTTAQQSTFTPTTAQQTTFNPMTAQYSSFSPMTAEQTEYRQSDDTTTALANLEELSRTGGLDDAAQQNLRARGVSPIRAQYATASRDMDRQRRLGGGTSANFGAVTSKMARDQSSLIADQMDKVNANIAEMVQSGRLSAAPNYASAASAESQRATNVATGNTANRQEANRFNAQGMFDNSRANAGAANNANQFNAAGANDTNQFNAGAVNRANEFNAGGANDTSRFNSNAVNTANQFNAAGANDTSRFNASATNDARNGRNSSRLGAVQGMTSLYGTTPALASLYGDQAHRTAEFTDKTKQRKKTNALAAFQSVYR